MRNQEQLIAKLDAAGNEPHDAQEKEASRLLHEEAERLKAESAEIREIRSKTLLPTMSKLGGKKHFRRLYLSTIVGTTILFCVLIVLFPGWPAVLPLFTALVFAGWFIPL